MGYCIECIDWILRLIQIIDLIGIHAPKDWIDSLPLDINVIECALANRNQRVNTNLLPFIDFVNKIKTESSNSIHLLTPNIHKEIYEQLLLEHLPVLSLKECLKTCISVIDFHSIDHSKSETETLDRTVTLVKNLVIRSSDKVIREMGDFELAWVVVKEREVDLATKLLKRVPELEKI